MKVLKEWEKEATCPPAFRRGWRGGRMRVLKCLDEFGNFVVWAETEYVNIGDQAASVVFGAGEEAAADIACFEIMDAEKPFVLSTSGREVHVHDRLFRRRM